MSTYYPNPTTHEWNDLVVGGSAGNPKFFLLTEENKIENGFFKDTVTNWALTDASRVAFDYAMRGSYVIDIEPDGKMHQAWAWAPSRVLLTGFVRFQNQDPSQVAAQIYIYPKNNATDTGIPAEYFQLNLMADTTIEGAAPLEWIPFYASVDTTLWSAFTYIHVDISDASGGVTGLYVDDLRMYEVNEVIDMECPQSLELIWQRKSDADYEMFNGDMKAYPKGWRPVFSIGYEYCSRAQLIKSIDISENTFCFFVPQDDGLMGVYTRMMNDFSSKYFRNKFLGHAQGLNLPSVFLQRYKNKQYGLDYYSTNYA